MLQSVLQRHGGVWLGWSGTLVDDQEDIDLSLSEHRDVTYAKLALPRMQFKKYYENYSNGALWPLLHGRPEIVEHDPTDFEAYREINRIFASVGRSLVGDDDLIWVHDYHLLPLAAELRAWGINNPIGFFLHVPIPAPDIIRTLPECDIIVAMIASFSVFGVQTQRDKDNLCALLTHYYDAKRRDDDTLTLFGRTLRVQSFPIGVDSTRIGPGEPEIAGNDVRAFIASLRKHRKPRLIVGVDRLDYSKGLVEKLSAFEQFLNENPALSKQTTFAQIAPLSRENVPAYIDLRSKVEQLAGRINAKHGSLTHQPLLLLTSGLAHDAVRYLLAHADVCFVASLMDGMNLVAKEYIAAQDPDDPGVLVLSAFAGAAEDMKSALIVNPYDRHQVAAALGKAMMMPKAERRMRYRKLMDVVRRTDAGLWAQSFVSALAGITGPEFETMDRISA